MHVPLKFRRIIVYGYQIVSLLRSFPLLTDITLDHRYPTQYFTFMHIPPINILCGKIFLRRSRSLQERTMEQVERDSNNLSPLIYSSSADNTSHIQW